MVADGQAYLMARTHFLLADTLWPLPVIPRPQRLPIQRFFQSPGFGSVMASVTTGIYFCLKVGVLREKGRLCLAALRQSVFGHDLLHAKHVSKEELVECGDVSCPICQEELAGMKNPIKLKCEHCFCEECILEWLDRSANCPMCRTVVKPAGLRSFACGDTAQAVVVF